MAVVPSGLTFLHPKRSRARVLVQYGPPITIAAPAPPEADAPDAARALTARLEASLRSLTINASDWDTVRALDTVRRLYQPPAIELDQRIELARRFNAHYPAVRDQPEVRAVNARSQAYQARLDELGVSDRELARGLHAGAAAGRVLRTLGFLLVWIPIMLPAAPLHLLSPDKRNLYFVSRRFGGYGGSDIYVSRMQANGKWGDPENLGPDINTPADEQCPFIHADNQTLYFTSGFWPGYGDEDLFYVRKQPDGSWSKPVNLGYPVNTIDREGTLFIAADGKTAYYASDRNDSTGGLDIYSFELRENIRPYKTLWVKGKVFDKKTNKGLPSTVELIDLGNKQPLTKVQTSETGDYLIIIPVGKD